MFVLVSVEIEWSDQSWHAIATQQYMYFISFALTASIDMLQSMQACPPHPSTQPPSESATKENKFHSEYYPDTAEPKFCAAISALHHNKVIKLQGTLENCLKNISCSLK